MAVKLDWQIEADHISQQDAEDPELRRLRYRRRRQLIVAALILAVIVGTVGGLVIWRLDVVDRELKQALIEVAQAEAAALRIGDYPAFRAIHKSDSQSWLNSQELLFKRYQVLKGVADFQITGQPISLAIRNWTGRVEMKEIINGVEYRTVWFYWRYAEGWRRVPNDYDFWGAEQTVSGHYVRVRYREMDAPTALNLALPLDKWWSEGCQLLSLNPCPTVTIAFRPQIDLNLGWEGNTLLVPSPLVREDRAPRNGALPGPMEDAVLVTLALRQLQLATGIAQPMGEGDVAWLYQTLAEWRAASFTGRLDAARHGLWQDLRTDRGAGGITAAARTLNPEFRLEMWESALGGPLELLDIDWRGYFQWRLDLERQYLAAGNLGAAERLWDVETPAARAEFNRRLASPNAPAGQVEQVMVQRGTDGQLRAFVQIVGDGSPPQQVIFRLAGGTWKRTAP
jgi:hypothetical protein